MNRLLFLLTIAASVAFAQGPAKSSSPNSLDRGIKDTGRAIRQLDVVIAQNQEDLSKIFAGDGFKFMKSVGGKELNWINILETGYAGFEAGKDLNSGDYGQALMRVAKVIADVWGEVDPRVKLGKAGVEVAGEVYEAQSLLRRQAQLLELRLKLQQQLYRLQGKNPLDLTQMEKIRTALDEDAVLHRKFLASLEQYNLERQEVTKNALKNASNKLKGVNQVASGMIVDPQADVDTLAALPGINPDFIRALRRQVELLQIGGVEAVRAAGMVDKYPDGSYINVFGPERNIRTPTKSDSSTSAPSGTSIPRPGITVQYGRRDGRTGVWVHGAGGQVLDSSEQNTYGMVDLAGFKDLNPGNYVFAFYEPGFGRLPIEVRKNYVTVITASPAQIVLSVEVKQKGMMDFGACACLADPTHNSIVRTGFGSGGGEKVCSGNPVMGNGQSAMRWRVAPGTYDVVTVDGMGCSNRLRSGYSPVRVTLEAGQTLDITTHPSIQ